MYSSPSIIGMIKLRRVRWAGHVAGMEPKRPLGRPRRRWVDNIKIDLRDVGWGGMECIDLSQDRDQWRAPVNTVMNLRLPQNFGEFSRRARLLEVSCYYRRCLSYDLRKL
jgi:hypothetical protein